MVHFPATAGANIARPIYTVSAGAHADPAYPLDGMNLLPALTQNAALVPRKLY